MTKVAVIIGGSGTLGMALIDLLLEKDYLVVGTYYTHPFPEGLILASKQHLVVSSPNSVKWLAVDLKEKFGQIDLIVNCAGRVSKLEEFEKASRYDFDFMMGVNVWGAFLVMKFLLPLLKPEGVLINVASRAAVRPVPRLALYSASKAAMMALTQAVAKEHPEVRIISVSPGGFRSPMREKCWGREDSEKQQPPEDIARKIYDIIIAPNMYESGINEVLVKNDTLVLNDQGQPVGSY